MSEKEQKSGKTSLNIGSKFRRTLLIIVTVFLIFAGPTYAVLVLLKVLDVEYFISMGSGFALFIVGLVLLLYLIKKGVIS